MNTKCGAAFGFGFFGSAAAAFSPLNVLVISFDQHPLLSPHTPLTHTHAHIAKLISRVTGYNHLRGHQASNKPSNRPTEIETEKTWPKLIMAAAETPEGRSRRQTRATIIKILLVGPYNATPNQNPALSLSSCLHFVSVYLPN